MPGGIGVIRPARGWVMRSGTLGDERGGDVRGVTVEGLAGAVVAHGGSRIGLAGCFLDVAPGDAGVERCGDEGVPEAVW